MSDARLTTPPPQPQAATLAGQLTPEQLRRMEINRLKAKAKAREWQAKQAAASSSSTPNSNNKRPITVEPHSRNAAGNDNTEYTRAPKPLPRDTRLMGKYIEYDLSKMVNRKGGFLVEDGKEIDEETRRKEMLREAQRAKQNFDPPVYLDPELTPKCRECGSVDIDFTFKKVFGCCVCNKCKNEKPELYSLLTKTECKEDYLLTDPELRDHELLPHLLKANPHSATWNNMMLFLRYQVEEYAINKKWGSTEALDAEYEKRVAEKKRQRQKKFEKGLHELRKRTKESLWQQRKDEEHHHDFGVTERTGEGGQGIQRCKTCGFEVEVEEF